MAPLLCLGQGPRIQIEITPSLDLDLDRPTQANKTCMPRKQLMDARNKQTVATTTYKCGDRLTDFYCLLSEKETSKHRCETHPKERVWHSDFSLIVMLACNHHHQIFRVSFICALAFGLGLACREKNQHVVRD